MVGDGGILIVSNFEVTVEKLVYGGDGLARLDGRVVFVPFVLPGERIRVKAEQEKPGLIRGKTLAVLEPSADRVAPPCPVFGRCGGCHYQHASYDHQVTIKASILVEELRRLGKIEPPEEIAVVTGEPWGYRNRVQLQVEQGRLGYLEMRSHKMCGIVQCPIASPKINGVIETLSRMLHDPKWPRMVRSLELFTDEDRVQLNLLETDRPVAKRFFDWCGESIPGLVEGTLDYNGHYRVSRGSFFQVNRFLLDKLIETAVDGIEGDMAFDLYAGVGLFAPALARKFRQVTAVESGAKRAAPSRARDGVLRSRRGGRARLAVQRRTRRSLKRSRGNPHGGSLLARPGLPGRFRAPGPAPRGLGQGGGPAALGTKAPASGTGCLRSGYLGSGSRRTGGRRLWHRTDGYGRFVSPNLPSGSRRAVKTKLVSA